MSKHSAGGNRPEVGDYAVTVADGPILENIVGREVTGIAVSSGGGRVLAVDGYVTRVSILRAADLTDADAESCNEPDVPALIDRLAEEWGGACDSDSLLTLIEWRVSRVEEQ